MRSIHHCGALPLTRWWPAAMMKAMVARHWIIILVAVAGLFAGSVVAQPMTVDGVTFSDAYGGFTIASVSGSGTIVIVSSSTSGGRTGAPGRSGNVASVNKSLDISPVNAGSR